MTKHIFVAVAWPYANGDLHLGRVAGALIPADIFARYHRLKGNHVLTISGSDAHGTPITLAADKESASPQAIFSRYHQSFLETQLALGISYDLFTHTDTDTHAQVAQDIFCQLYEAGYIFPQTQRLLYSETEQRFLPDRYVEGTCPHCGDLNARGDQCDNCGQVLDATELIDPRSTLDGSRPIVRKTDHLFLDLPAFANQLQLFLDSHADHWRANPLNFSRSWLAQGLKPRPITRDLDWGIPVPLAGWEEKKLYIWFENIIGYLSASVAWAREQGEPDAWKAWWYNPAAESYYFLGKDNIPFHTIIWPAQLLGIERLYETDTNKRLNLPHDVPANHFLTLEGRQFSSSRNWAIWLPELLERYQPDQLRYYLAATLPETSDSDFSWVDFVQRNNSELVGTWGNLVNRVTTFAYKHWNGRIPTPSTLRPIDHDLRREIEAGFETVGGLLTAVKLRPALQAALALARSVNGYLDSAPWYQVIKSDRQEAATTVYTALWAIDSLKILLAPFLPFSSETLHQTLGYTEPLFRKQKITTIQEATQSHQALVYDDGVENGRWQPSDLPPNQQLRKPRPLFAKLDSDVAAREVERLRGAER
ncbi:MAG: methionine--tRNA ligase [Chloroflexota bacterium]